MFNIVFSLLFASLPYAFLRLKLQIFRTNGSHEGEILIGELLNQYKINYFNMIEAIDKTIPVINDAPHTQRLLLRLSLRLKNSKKDEELLECLKEFTYGIDTEWIKMLSNNLYLTIQDDFNVSIGLNDILNELRKEKSNYEIDKRINSEGFAIVRILSPLMYAGSIYVAVKYFDFTIKKFLDYQFNTATGFKYFIIMALLFIINLGIMISFKNKKFDI